MADTNTTQAALAGVLSGLFGDSKFSDMTIECEGRKWAVHQAIICTQNEYFMKACSGQFKEARKKVIVLQEDFPDAINAMVKFFYKGDYDADLSKSANSSASDLHVAVYIAADKYGVTKLAELATRKLKSSMKPDSADFVRVARNLWSSEEKPETLRSVVCEVLDENKQLLQRGSKSELAQFIRQTPALAAELCFGMAEASMRKFSLCTNCSRTAPLPKTLSSGSKDNYFCPACHLRSSGKTLEKYAASLDSPGRPWTKA
ncbi:unnamed protein product [Cercospora beticola]|nr:unnamed protein product [Cercospora beticola]